MKEKRISIEEIAKKLGHLKDKGYSKTPRPNRTMNTLEQITEISKELYKTNFASLEFLYELDCKLHCIKQMSRMMPNFPSLEYQMEVAKNPYVDYDDYTEEKITAEEASKFMTTVKMGVENGDMILYPITACSGFQVGFNVDLVVQPSYPGIPIRTEPILEFLEKQLPEGYNFNKLSEIFNTERNKTLVKLYELPEIRDRVYYDY